jgi:NADH-quinone oxidoreductase subunit M
VTHEENKHLEDLGAREVVLMLPLVVLAVWIGFRPTPFLDQSRGSLDRLVQKIELARGTMSASLPAVRDAAPGATAEAAAEATTEAIREAVR